MINGLNKIKCWVQSILPLTFDESLSYYEVLAKVVNYINNMLDAIKGVVDENNKLADAYNKFFGPNEQLKPIANYAGGLYNPNSNIITYSGLGFRVLKYNVTGLKNVFVTANGLSSYSGGFWFINYLDAGGNFIKGEYEVKTTLSLTGVYSEVPENACYLLTNCYNADSVVYGAANLLQLLHNEINEIRELNILFVGNSLTQDAISYVPYLLKKFFPEIKFNFYMWYNGGYTLAQQYTAFVNNTVAQRFDKCENAEGWTLEPANRTMERVCNEYTFDIVCLQDYFINMTEYGATQMADLVNCQEYIANHYTKNPLEFIFLAPAPTRYHIDREFGVIIDAIKYVMQNNVTQDVIPAGISMYRAFDTDLDSLGAAGHLSPDDVHTQEGLPCLLLAYTVICWMLDKLAINKSIYAIPFKMNYDAYAAINVPGPNIGSGIIPGTDAENRLAQKLAIMGYKEGKKLVIDNLTGETYS